MHKIIHTTRIIQREISLINQKMNDSTSQIYNQIERNSFMRRKTNGWLLLVFCFITQTREILLWIEDPEPA